MRNLLRLRRGKKGKKRLAYLLPLSILTVGIALIIGVYAVSFLLGPPPLANDQNTIYYGINGNVIGEERGAQNRYWVGLDEMPANLINATLAIEDKRFYEHNGFDLMRIASAVVSDIKSFSLKEGASTLTQQYARNLYLSHEKTWLRKLKEAFYTIRLEMHYSKKEILEGYLNTIYYGHGAYGAEAASRHFFDKPADNLTLAEAAILAGIPKGPAYYSPFNNLENAEQRQDVILDQMLANGYISKQERRLATREKLTFTDAQERERVPVAPYFQDAVLKEAASILNLDSEKVRSGGYEIYTTLDKHMQKQLKQHASDVIRSGSDIQLGAMAMNPDTGGVRALVGGRDYTKSQFNRAMQAKRMPGSSFKPFLYYAALKNGYTPTTMLMSKPTAFRLENGKVYQPSNYNGYYADKPISLAQALALSDNVYAVKTNLYLGPQKLVETARKFGIESKLPAVPSLALGSAAVSVEEMVTGYGMLANGGHRIDSHTVMKIVNKNGKTVFERDNTDGEQVLDQQTAFVLTQLLTGMFDHALDGYMQVTGASVANQLSRTYAGKSGTTNADSWMIGYSPSLAVGVWTGYDDNRQMVKTAEKTYAKNIWASFMEDAHTETAAKQFQEPPGVTGIAIDPDSGKRATPYCEDSRVMYFENGTAPKEYCKLHMPENKQQPEEDNKKDQHDKKGVFKRIVDFLF
ncbi:transglycosylase domain-containing protein [Lentibacillus cibarius]|uniref:PBP1A family penicillin-binding protein n=1 Tax=Lentibacillus cibarius TaxID=2583219 RepID=A0A5S3QJD9_9BACI|nr:PBP1A family penicillin-binding protein [Lentibacillus cibarius]TMN22034.1 PBP1A family penicillin-binding protein [Lentibacillus cibarius]